MHTTQVFVCVLEVRTWRPVAARVSVQDGVGLELRQLIERETVTTGMYEWAFLACSLVAIL